MKDTQFKIAVKLRLGLPLPGIATNIKCICTNEPILDKYGHHIICCPTRPFRITRHNKCKEFFESTASRAGDKVYDEDRRHICEDVLNQNRPNIKNIVPDFTTSSIDTPERAYDVTIVHPKKGSTNIHTAETVKIQKYQATLEQHNIQFFALPMDTYGQLHPNVIKFIKTKSAAIAAKHGGYASVIANYLFCRLSIILQAANADMILDKVSHIAHKRSRNLYAHFAPHQDALDTAIASLDAREN